MEHVSTIEAEERRGVTLAIEQLERLPMGKNRQRKRQFQLKRRLDQEVGRDKVLPGMNRVSFNPF
jgi:hypothetical protein